MYRPLCKDCTCAEKGGDEAAKARSREYKKRVYPLKREELIRKSVAWNRANRDRAREIQRASQKRSRLARPEQYRASGRKQARRRLLGRDEPAVDYASILLCDPCVYCGARATTVDHIDALNTGGANEWTNLTAACGPCNSSKRDVPMLRWLAMRM